MKVLCQILLLSLISVRSSAVATSPLRGPAESWGSNPVNRLVIKKCQDKSYRVLSGDSSIDPESACSNIQSKQIDLSTAYLRTTNIINDSGVATSFGIDAGYMNNGTINQLFQLSVSSMTVDRKSFVQDAGKCFQLLKMDVVTSFYVSAETNNNVVQCGSLTQ